MKGADPRVGSIQNGTPLTISMAASTMVHLGGGDKVDFFEHFCTIGNPAGHSPNALDFAITEQQALNEFDAAFYLEAYADVAAAPIDPWEHFSTYGWSEGRNPSASFDTHRYLNEYLEVDANPLLHYVRIGRYRGPIPAPSGGYSGAIFRYNSHERRDLKALLDFLGEDDGSSQEYLGDASLLNRSPWFDEAHYRAVTGLSLVREELVEHYLGVGVEHGYSIHPQFDAGFYTSTYGLISPGIGDESAIIHFLRKGRQLGYYPSRDVAMSDVRMVRASGLFNAEIYQSDLQACGIDPGDHSLLVHCTLFGHLIGAQCSDVVDIQFIDKCYRATTEADLYSPLAYYARHRNSPWIYPNLHDLMEASRRISESEYFDPIYYRGIALLEGFKGQLEMHYATVGTMEQIAASVKFDTETYSYFNPDVARAALNPLIHYDMHGQLEGRKVGGEVHVVASEEYRNYDSNLETVIIFCHEGSKTGAPIVGLNLAISLSRNANVIAFIADKPDDLLDEFSRVCVRVLTGEGSRSALTLEVTRIIEKFGCSYAIVNSVCCHHVIAVLDRLGVVTVALVHEFADYVLPSGTLSQMVLGADRTIFPARIVQASYVKEAAKHGVRIIESAVEPQGRNGIPVVGRGSGSSIEVDVNDLLNEIKISDSNAKGTRVLLGVGSVEPRKGLDLFFQTASILQKIGDWDWRFLWVGGGYDPSIDFNTSLFVDQLIRECGLSDCAFILKPRGDLRAIWEVADVFFLSSRLDPYPNVALDALQSGVPLVCFKGAGGIAELAADFPFAVSAVDFADVQSAANAISSRASDLESIAIQFSGAKGDLLRSKMSFDDYVEKIMVELDRAKLRREEVSIAKSRLDILDWRDLESVHSAIPSSVGGGFLPRRRDGGSRIARYMSSDFSLVRQDCNEYLFGK